MNEDKKQKKSVNRQVQKIFRWKEQMEVRRFMDKIMNKIYGDTGKGR